MNASKSCRPRWRAAGLGLLLILVEVTARAGGLPEPDLILYGKVIDVAGNANLRLGSGILSWTFQPSDGSPAVTLSTTLTNLNNEYSYVLRVPCETPVFSFAAATNTLPLKPMGMIINRAYVTWNGTNLLSFVQPALTNFQFGATDRGRVEELDLQVSAPLIIDPFNGLPVDWEMSHFGHLRVDPNADPDQDGMTNMAEYLAGTDPNDPNSRFLITGVQPVADGIQITWLSTDFRSYSLQRSTNFIGGFTDLVPALTATPPTNNYVDHTALGGGPYFYRVRLNH